MEKTKFESLYAQWQTHIAQPRVRTSSNPSTWVNCPPYKDIVGLGRGVLPYIIEKMRAGESSGWKESEFFLWRAAEEVSGAGLSAGEVSPSEQTMAHRYIAWWEKNQKKS
jgi:hypothetical protein